MKHSITTLGIGLLLAGAAMGQDLAPQGDKKEAPERAPRRPMAELDTDKDGKVSKQEFLAGPRAKANPEMAEKLFERMDSDKDGFLSEKDKPAPRPHPFMRLDSDKDEKVSKEEWMQSERAKQDSEKAAEIFTKIDKNSDGFIDKAEMKQHMEHMQGAGRGGKGPKRGGPKGDKPAGGDGPPPPPPADDTDAEEADQ